MKLVSEEPFLLQPRVQPQPHPTHAAVHPSLLPIDVGIFPIHLQYVGHQSVAPINLILEFN